jgi:hypothetical protein
VNNMNERPSLYYNASPMGNWISLQLVGVKSNRAALGAVVTLEQNNDKDQDKDIDSARRKRAVGMATSRRATCGSISASVRRPRRRRW